MGLLKGLHSLFSTEGIVWTSARAYQHKFPGTPFIEALERSLVETRPGWTQDLWDHVAPTIRVFGGASFNQKEIEEYMVAQVARIERARRAA